MDYINTLITDPKVQLLLVTVLTVAFKALWNAVRDQSRAIEEAGPVAKDMVRLMRSKRKPLSRAVIELTRGWVEMLDTGKPANKVLKDTVNNLIGKK